MFKLSFFIALLLASSALAAAPDCSTSNNPFLNWAINQVDGVVLKTGLDSASVPDGACKTLWTNNSGTCCNGTKLQELYKKQVSTRANAWGKFVSGVNKFRRVSKRLLRLLNKKGEVASKLGSDFTLTDENLAQLKDFLNGLKDKIKSFKKEAKTCFKALHAYKGYGICLGCSGKGASYYDVGPVLKIQSGSCNKVIDTCASTWSFMAQLQESTYVAGLISSLQKGKSKPSDAATKLKNNIKMSDILATFKTCEGTCSNEQKDQICKAFFDIAEVPSVAADNSADTVEETRILEGSTNSGVTIDSKGADLSSGETFSELSSSTELDTSGVQEEDEEEKTSAVTKALAAFGAIAVTIILV